jgi:streptogramin lyase
LPYAESRPRRIAITSDDVIWYSDYGRGALGRFDPKTGEAREWPSPGGSESGPYGIATVNNIVWYSESGRSRIRSCASIRRPRPSRLGPSPPAEASCAT